MGYILYRELRYLDDGGKSKFKLDFIKMNGERVVVNDCTCTSFYSKGLTMNIQFPGYAHPITIHRIQIQYINDKRLIL